VNAAAHGSIIGDYFDTVTLADSEGLEGSACVVEATGDVCKGDADTALDSVSYSPA
jgi:hypothetical protein